MVALPGWKTYVATAANAIRLNNSPDAFCLGDTFTAVGSVPPSSFPITFTCWAKLNVAPSGSGIYGGIFSIEDGNGSSTQWNEIIVNENSSNLTVYDHTVGLRGTIGAMTVGVWHRIAFVITSGSWAGYIGTEGGGSLTKVTGTLSNVGTVGYSGLGSTYFRTSEWFNGSLSHARVWTAALSDAEIAAELSSASPVRAANLFGAWLPSTVTVPTAYTAISGSNLAASPGGGGITHTVVTGPTLYTPIVVGATGFDANYNDRLQQTTNLPATDTWTYCAWIKINDSNGSRPFAIEQGATYQAFSISGGTGRDIYINTNLGTGTVLRTLSTGVWYFAALSATSTGGTPTMNLYVRAEGESALTNNSRTGVASLVPSSFSIGGAGSLFGSTPNGSICLVRLWDRVLSQSELLAESNSTTPVSTTNLIGSYPMASAATVLTAAVGSNLTNPSGSGSWTDAAGPTI